MKENILILNKWAVIVSFLLHLAFLWLYSGFTEQKKNPSDDPETSKTPVNVPINERWISLNEAGSAASGRQRGGTWGGSVGSKFKSSFRWLQVQVWAVGKLRRHHQHQDPIRDAEASAVQRRVPGHRQGVQTLLPQSEEGQRWESSVTFNSHCNRRHDQVPCSFWWCFRSNTVIKIKKATLSSDATNRENGGGA